MIETASILIAVVMTTGVTSIVWWTYSYLVISAHEYKNKELKKIYKDRLAMCEEIRWRMHQDIDRLEDELIQIKGKKNEQSQEI